MNFLKPLYFSKYRPTQVYEYDSTWQSVFLNEEDSKISVRIKKVDQPKGVIILSHPMFILGKYFFIEFGHAAYYHQLGYHVVLFDFNGFGESKDNGFSFRSDIQSVFDYTKSTYKNLPIFLHGVSFGASQVITLAANNQNDIKGVVIESATSSNLDYYKGRAKNLYHLLNIVSTVFPSKNAHNLFYNEVKRITNDLPILFIYGKKDVKTPVWMGEKLFNYTTSINKEFALFDTKHLTTIKEEPSNYKQAIKRLLEA